MFIFHCCTLVINYCFLHFKNFLHRMWISVNNLTNVIYIMYNKQKILLPVRNLKYLRLISFLNFWYRDISESIKHQDTKLLCMRDIWLEMCLTCFILSTGRVQINQDVNKFNYFFWLFYLHWYTRKYKRQMYTHF